MTVGTRRANDAISSSFLPHLKNFQSWANSRFSVNTEMNVDRRNVGTRGSNVWTGCNIYIFLNEHFRSPSAKQKMEWRGGNLGCGSELRSARDLPFSVRLLLTRNILRCYWKRGTQSWPLIGCSYNDRQRSGGSEACQGYSERVNFWPPETLSWEWELPL